MNDGHSGTENKEVNRGTHGGWLLILAYLKQGTGESSFVIHATINYQYGSGLEPVDFLLGIGFKPYNGICVFHGDKCFYREIARLPSSHAGIMHHDVVHQIHKGFERFSEKIGDLFDYRRKEAKILEEIGVDASQRIVFGAPIEIELGDEDVPLWVNDVKFNSLIGLERQQAEIQVAINEQSVFLPLLFGSGKTLEHAVVEALRFLGLKADFASKGFTADVLAKTQDGSLKFGFEVTGTSGPIRKSSNKLTQVLDFERIKKYGEKTILVANTYNTTPVLDRKDLESFTQPVLDFLGKHPILLMTSWDLYRMVRDVLAGSRTKPELVKMLHETTGLLAYD